MFISCQSVLDFDFLPSNEVLNTLSVLPFLVNWWMAPLQLLGRFLLKGWVDISPADYCSYCNSSYSFGMLTSRFQTTRVTRAQLFRAVLEPGWSGVESLSLEHWAEVTQSRRRTYSNRKSTGNSHWAQPGQCQDNVRTNGCWMMMMMFVQSCAWPWDYPCSDHCSVDIFCSRNGSDWTLKLSQGFPHQETSVKHNCFG
jgi:hypothetical protein